MSRKSKIIETEFWFEIGSNNKYNGVKSIPLFMEYIRPHVTPEYFNETNDEIKSSYQELDLKIAGSPVPHHRATRIDPEEGGYFEDIRCDLILENSNVLDITDHLTEKFIQKINERLTQTLIDIEDDQDSREED